MIEIIAEQNPGISPHEHGISLLQRELNKRYPQMIEYRIVKNPCGKPSLENCSEFHYNISHSGKWTVIAVSDQEIGIDIQHIRPVKPGLAKRFFTRRENLKLDSLPKNEIEACFTRMWTMKEARVKASGESLAKNISELNTISYDSTWSTFIKGYHVLSIPFPDNDYMIACSSPQNIESNYVLSIHMI